VNNSRYSDGNTCVDDATTVGEDPHDGEEFVERSLSISLLFFHALESPLESTDHFGGIENQG
jgi:hypothetical protein